jgi:hypothetical protein
MRGRSKGLIKDLKPKDRTRKNCRVGGGGSDEKRNPARLKAWDDELPIKPVCTRAAGRIIIGYIHACLYCTYIIEISLTIYSVIILSSQDTRSTGHPS